MSASHTYLYNPLAALDQVVWLDTVDQQTLTDTSEVTDHPVEASTGVGSVTDHQINHPRKISIVGFVSNTPLNDLSFVRKGDGVPVNVAPRGFVQPINIRVPDQTPAGGSNAARAGLTSVQLSNVSAPHGERTIGFNGLVFTDDVNRVKETLVFLSLWKDQKTLITYIDPLFIYRNMAVESFSYTPEGKIESTGQPGGATFTIDLKQVVVVKSASVDAPKPKEPRGQHEKSKGKTVTEPTELFDYYETLDGTQSQIAPKGTPPDNLRDPLTGEFDAGGGWVLIGAAA